MQGAQFPDQGAETEPAPPAVAAWSPSRWAGRAVPQAMCLIGPWLRAYWGAFWNTFGLNSLLHWSAIYPGKLSLLFLVLSLSSLSHTIPFTVAPSHVPWSTGRAPPCCSPARRRMSTPAQRPRLACFLLTSASLTCPELHKLPGVWQCCPGVFFLSIHWMTLILPLTPQTCPVFSPFGSLSVNSLPLLLWKQEPPARAPSSSPHSSFSGQTPFPSPAASPSLPP